MATTPRRKAVNTTTDASGRYTLTRKGATLTITGPEGSTSHTFPTIGDAVATFLSYQTR